MPLFICKNCGCIENTALGFYWPAGAEPLCSECAFGKWHGYFDKKYPRDYTEEQLDKMRILNKR